jgi:rhamnogalacturonan endolyase
MNVMKKMESRKKGLLRAVILTMVLSYSGMVSGQRHMEYLTRGLVAVKRSGGVFVSWRIFATDTARVEFNLYRNDTLVNQDPITGVSNYLDTAGTSGSFYYLETITDSITREVSDPVTVWAQNYLQIPLQTPGGYSPNDASVADLDGDGEFEIIVKMEGSTRDNSQSGYTDPVYLHAYKMNGTLLWSINLGINIRGGAHYTQFMVYDLDSDGRAEVACKTAPGTRDGSGNFLNLGPAAGDDDAADYRNSSGYILSGPEYLTVFDGQTGLELSTVGYIPLRADPYPLNSWGDTYGNRVDRFLACVAYFDSIPSLVMCRGYYDRTTLTAWDYTDGQLVQRWAFDTETDQANLRQYEGQGSHGISVGDVDNDGKDEIMYGAMAFDDDGTPLYNTRFGHGDASHMSDLVPDHPGLEFYMPHETAGSVSGGVTVPGISVRDAATGEIVWSIPSSGDIGRAMTADITAAYPGNEFWASSGLGIYNSQGNKINGTIPSINFAAWWDGDLLRELVDGNVISKWGVGNMLAAAGCSSNNGTKSTPALSGDILGDWREEVIWRTSDNQALRIYTTVIPTQYGLYTLLQDPQYRLALAWQNVAYNQPPHPGFFLGDGMADPPVPNIKVLEKNNDPRLHIVSPRNGFELNLGYDLQVVIQTAGISDTSQMIVLFDHDTLILDTIPSPPYNTSIAGLTSGEHRLTAMGWDLSGNKIYSNPITFTVDEGYPHITLISPRNNAIYGPGDAIPLQAEAYDTDGTIDSVAFFVDGLHHITLSQEPYVTQLEAPGLGIHSVMAVAYDNTGKETPSEVVEVEVGAITIIQEEEVGFCGFANGSGSIDNNHPGHTGSGFANSENILGVQIVWAVTVVESGDYQFTWRYAAVEARPGKLYINDDLIGTVDFGNTGEWTTWDVVSLSVPGLTTGLRKITLEASGGSGLANIDYLKMTSLSGEVAINRAHCSTLPTGTEGAVIGVPEERFDLFPVPAAHNLQVRFHDPAEEVQQLVVYSIDGRPLIKMDHPGSNEAVIDLPGLENGIYLVRITTNREDYTRKFSIAN